MISADNARCLCERKENMSFIRRNWQEEFVKLIFAILLTACLAPFLNQVAEKFLPNQKVSISVRGSSGISNIYILDNGFCDLFQEEKLNNFISENEWIFLQKGNDYAFDMLYIGGDISGKTYSFEIKPVPNFKLTFWANPYGSCITIKTKNTCKEIDLYSEFAGGEVKSCYIFEDSNTLFIIKGILFFICLIIVCVLLLTVCYFVRENAMPPILEREPNWELVLALFFVFYILDIILYKNNLIPNLLEFGDQVWYWDGLWNDEGGNISSVHKYIRVWNGYLCFYIPYICRLIGQALAVDPLYIWFMISSASAAIMIGYSIPQIYTFCTSGKAKVWQSFLFALIYAFFWSGTLSAVLMDLIGISTLFFAIAMMTGFISSSKLLDYIIYGALAGLMFSVSISFRTVHLFCVPFIILFFLVIYIKENCTTRKWECLKKVVPGLLSLFLAFGLVCIPQTKINYNIGVSYPFPYEDREIWNNGIYNRSLSEYSMNMTFDGAFSAYSFPTADSHAESMKKAEYNTMDTLTMSQGLELFMSQPMDTITYIAKKLFVGFDSKTGVTYPDFTLKKDVRFYIFSFFNYFIFASAIYVLLRKKINIKIKIFLGILFLTLILPHTWMHVEWRYYLVGYLMIYFLFVYFFFENTKETPNRAEKVAYLAFVNVVIVFEFLISLEFYSRI